MSEGRWGGSWGRWGEIYQGTHRHRCIGRGHRRQYGEGWRGGCRVERVLLRLQRGHLLCFQQFFKNHKIEINKIILTNKGLNSLPFLKNSPSFWGYKMKVKLPVQLSQPAKPVLALLPAAVTGDHSEPDPSRLTAMLSQHRCAAHAPASLP